MRIAPAIPQQTGFSLIEVMVALLIISIGLLGVARMQAQAIGNTKVSSSRSIAAIHAASMASAMHANKAYWAAGLAPASAAVTGTSISDATLNGQTVTDCVANSCSPVQMAAFDLQAWGSSLLAQLPAGAGTVVCSTTLGTIISCSVTVTWNEKYIGLNTATLDSSKVTATQSLNLLVAP